VNPLVVFVCDACGEAFYPARALCPRCGDERPREEVVEDGVVEQATVHRGVPLASVRTSLGPVVIARCAEPAGTRVRLASEDGAPVAVT
jgi:uncharacterized OB-fold protein